MENQPNVATPFIVFLNQTGDVAIEWDDANEEAILALIEEKMKQGIRFFILKPVLGGLLGSKKKQATSIKQIRKAGNVLIEDQDAATMLGKMNLDDRELEKVVESGAAQLVRGQTSRMDLTTTHQAKSAKEVLKSQSLAVRPLAGG